MGKNSDYESLLKIMDMNSLEHRRIEQSLKIIFKCFKEVVYLNPVSHLTILQVVG